LYQDTAAAARLPSPLRRVYAPPKAGEAASGGQVLAVTNREHEREKE
jgi:hypothetical protein